MKPSTVLKVLHAADAFRRPQRFEDFLLACEADARGRTGFEDCDYPQADYLRHAFRAAAAVSPRPFVEQGLEGAAIRKALDRERLAVIRSIRADQAPKK